MVEIPELRPHWHDLEGRERCWERIKQLLSTRFFLVALWSNCELHRVLNQLFRNKVSDHVRARRKRQLFDWAQQGTLPLDVIMIDDLSREEGKYWMALVHDWGTIWCVAESFQLRDVHVTCLESEEALFWYLTNGQDESYWEHYGTTAAEVQPLFNPCLPGE